MTAFEEIAEGIRQRFAEKYAAREKALQMSREVIRHSANAIRAVHRNELDRAGELLTRARETLEQVHITLAGHPEVHYAGFVHDAEKEFAEASVTLATIAGQEWPTPAVLEVGDAAYLNGAGEAVGELRRYLLDVLRRGSLERTEAILASMDEIYAELVTIDYPDGLTGGLRRTTDMVRGVLEKTRGDLTLAWRQQTLAERVDRLQQHLGPESPLPESVGRALRQG